MAALWVSGGTVDWQSEYVGQHPQRISAPTYPFARVRHWPFNNTPNQATCSQEVASVEQQTSGEATTMQRFIRQTIAQQLGQSFDDIALERNYFELGLTSLEITHLVQQINQLLDISLSPGDVFDYWNIDKLAAYLAEQHHSKIASLALYPDTDSACEFEHITF